jgi:hypothetical protein
MIALGFLLYLADTALYSIPSIITISPSIVLSVSELSSSLELLIDELVELLD